MASKQEQKQTESKKSETGLDAEAETDEILMELQDLLYKLKESQLQGVFDLSRGKVQIRYVKVID